MSEAQSFVARWELRAPLLFAVGQLVLLLVLTRETGPLAIAIAQGVVALALVAALARTATPMRAIAAFATLSVAAAATLWLALAGTDQLWLVALGLVVGMATLAYGLHRYESVALGLVTDSEVEG